MRAVVDRHIAIWRPLGIAIGTAALLAVVPASPARAHAQLVSSTPGPGEVVSTAPEEIRLVFSEPIEASYSSLDVLDSEGRALATDIGQPDPENPMELVAPFPGTGEGTYTVNWRALSAADGHVTSGFLIFGVGDVQVTGTVGGPAADAGGLHVGHDQVTGVGDVIGRSLTYLGFMLAAGLGIIAWLVVQPVVGRVPRWLLVGQGAALLLAAVGSVLLFFVMEAALRRETDSGGAVDLLGSRTGLLVIVRAGVGVLGAVAVVAAARAHPRLAVTAGSLAGAVALALVASAGHAAGYAAMAPVASDLVHLLSAGIWLAGLVTLTVLFGFARADAGAMQAVVPRFSAIALVSIALVVASGTYASWLAIHDFTPWDSPYGVNLLVKVAVVAVALGLGALNYFDGGRNLGSMGGMGRRVLVETGLALGVIVLTANLTTGVPPSGAQPVPLAAAASIDDDEAGVRLAVQPGRPGPNRLVVEVDRPPGGHVTAELILQRRDADVGPARVTLRALHEHSAAGGEADPQSFALEGVTLPEDSSWDASVVLLGPAGQEVARERYAFTFDAEGIASGRDSFPLDPALLIGLGLGAAGLLAISYWFGGGVLPRTNRAASRVALLGGGTIACILALAMLLSGPRL